MANKDRQPIIIRRVKKHAHGHHGGAWKIAYADFVTAMMAFFLLMWLLGSTTKGDLQGIADYFRTPLKVAFTGGSGAGETTSVIQGGSNGFARTNSEALAKVNKVTRGQKAAAEAVKLAAIKRRVEQSLDSQPRMKAFRSQVRLDMTSDGLQIQIVDDQSRPMFDTGSAIVKDYMRDILRDIGAALNDVDYRITLSGHTDAAPYQNGDRGYSNWELSADRANASRRELIAGGMDEKKVLRVVGAGSSVGLNKDDPLDPVNRRISILVMNKDAEERALRDMGAIKVSGAGDLEDQLAGKVPREQGAAAASGAPGVVPAPAASSPADSPAAKPAETGGAQSAPPKQ